MTREPEERCPNGRGERHSVVGVEVQGVYDGVLFWRCEVDGACIHRWPRGHRLHEAAESLWHRWANDTTDARSGEKEPSSVKEEK